MPQPAATENQADPRYVDHAERFRFWRGPFESSTWRAFGYLCAAMGLAPFAFTYTVFTVSFSGGVAVTVVGLFVSGALVLGGRMWGSLYRSMARSMLSLDVRDPRPYSRPQGFWRIFFSALGDATGWRALLFGFIMFPFAIASFVMSVTFLGVCLGSMTYWIWWQFLPAQLGADGQMHRGAQFGTGYFIDTPMRLLGLALAGIVLLWVWAAITRGLVAVYRIATIALLAPTKASLRVASLEKSRGLAVEDSNTKLRRIERDLHDGTQARLVAVAMQLGEAKEQLAEGDAASAQELVDSAHASTKEALVELREIARGIHPPALDNGLALALETLAARSPIPVTVDVDPRVDVAPAVETIAYFCVAELLTNVAKHARASGAYVLVEEIDQTLRIRVRDDGKGGARIQAPDAKGHQSGLAGLAERVRSVDGTFDLVSPDGGPTVVTVTLPRKV